ncbi:hypothetical protein C8R47DRAFT_1321554 [Mycena vitilis]|nr:hypothetical protein C8R47DRAFT_1321554 [Mycena vitilis]
MNPQQQAAADEGQRIFRLNFIHIIGLTILFFDHLITLDTEINLLWRRSKSLSAHWFYINRYFGFFSGIAVSALPFVTLSVETCRQYSFVREVILVATQAITSVIMIIRVYALYGRSRRILWFLLGLGAIVVAVSVYSFTQQHGSRPMILGGCHFNLSGETSFRLAGSWEGLFVFDTIIFVLTVYNAFLTRRRMIPSTGLYTLVVRDGAMYFGIVALANLANIASYYFPNSGVGQFPYSIICSRKLIPPQIINPGSLSTLASCVSVTMISRLILNLHEHANAGIMTDMNSDVVQQNVPLRSLPDIPMVLTEPELSSQAHPVLTNAGPSVVWAI